MSYNKHLRSYENLLAESNAWNWADSAKITIFKKSLNKAMQGIVANNALNLKNND